MECGFLLVAEESIRDPYLLPHALSQLDLLQTRVVIGRIIRKSRILPLLSQVEVDRIILQSSRVSSLR